jgi:prevent-host-death family protein
MVRIINVHEAKTHLLKILDQVRDGEEIILAKAGRPYAKLVPIEQNARAFLFLGDSQERVKQAKASWPPYEVFLSSLGPRHSASPYPRMPLRHSPRSRPGAKSSVFHKTFVRDRQNGSASSAHWRT